jgi:hypothetical protein
MGGLVTVPSGGVIKHGRRETLWDEGCHEQGVASGHAAGHQQAHHQGASHHRN